MAAAAAALAQAKTTAIKDLKANENSIYFTDDIETSINDANSLQVVEEKKQKALDNMAKKAAAKKAADEAAAAKKAAEEAAAAAAAAAAELEKAKEQAIIDLKADANAKHITDDHKKTIENAISVSDLAESKKKY